jgi:membrane protein implicated in regulation of membrane protease activity
MQWLFPAALLVLIPKCPMCVVAYVALFTGMGISVSTARWIQIVMLAFCLASLAFLAVRYVSFFLRSTNVHRTRHAR